MEPPLVRAAVRDLAVGVRTVTEAPMRGISVLAFWESLGMTHSHECVKSGHTYSISVQQQVVQVGFPVYLVVTWTLWNLLCRKSWEVLLCGSSYFSARFLQVHFVVKKMCRPMASVG